MRIVSGFVVAAAMLAALAEPALAVCIIRGGARTCTPDPKYWKVEAEPEKDVSAATPATSLKAIVMQPSTMDDNAWVMTPENGGGATPVSAAGTAAACSLGLDC